jgi:hypothetical protein
MPELIFFRRGRRSGASPRGRSEDTQGRTTLKPAEIAGLLGMEAAGIEPASRRKQNPKQVALLPANALSSQRWGAACPGTWSRT